MRERKFRGQFEGVWWYVRVSDDHISSSWEQFWALVDRKTVGEYIGLTDKNGKEIYEGDIIVTRNEQQGEYPVEEQYRGVVTYQGDGYHIVQPHDSYTPTLLNLTIAEREVIGNIYEHPELLEMNDE